MSTTTSHTTTSHSSSTSTAAAGRALGALARVTTTTALARISGLGARRGASGLLSTGREAIALHQRVDDNAHALARLRGAAVAAEQTAGPADDYAVEEEGPVERGQVGPSQATAATNSSTVVGCCVQGWR